jgi:pimeloyl-ACP methyl ester carboxylesterase
MTCETAAQTASAERSDLTRAGAQSNRAIGHDMPTKYVNVAGVATHFLYSGPTTLPPEPPRYDRGRALLFLHGAGGNAGNWRRQVDHFGAAHGAVALDYPGHGRSGSTDGLGSVEAYADFTADFAAAVQLPPAVVLGTCMGGAVALELAASHPEKVQAAVLVGMGAALHFAAATVELWRNVSYGRAPQPFNTDLFSPRTDFAVMRELWMEQVKTDPRVRYTDMLACNDFDGGARLAAMACPVLVVAGRDDGILPVEAAAALQRGIAGSRLVVLEDAGHCAPSERADAFNAAVDEFLATLPTRGAA